MDEVEDEDEEYNPTRFPLTNEDISKIGRVANLIRGRFPAMTPEHLRSAAAVLRALERLPVTTPGIQVTFSFVQPSTDGNYGWADVYISEDEFTLGIGEHFYDPAVGGDTESRHAFEAVAGGSSSEGDIDDWIYVAANISTEGKIRVEDYSDYEAIDWTSESADAEDE